MSFLDRIFGGKSAQHQQPAIRFGRYSDAYKTLANNDAWEASVMAYEEEDYLNAYEHFFQYLRDEQEDNVRYERRNDTLQFEVFQGSKKIKGTATPETLRAVVRIAQTSELHVSFMRRLIEKNFDLKFSRYALDEEKNIAMVFHTYSLDGSPYKLYNALKEMAIQADKQDDLLLNEFTCLQPVDNSHLQEISNQEKEVKVAFIRQEVDRLLLALEKGPLSLEQYPIAYTYLILSTVYKLDYLTKPEGFTMEILERIHHQFYSSDKLATLDKVRRIVVELRRLKERSTEDFFEEIYAVRSTFGITPLANHDRICTLIVDQLDNMDWYEAQGYDQMALAIPGFIIGQSMFIHAVPKPDRELFHLYYQIVEIRYFQELGFALDFYDPANRKLNRRAIKRAVQQIADRNRDRYPDLNPDPDVLEFDTLINFCRSYLRMIQEMDCLPVY